MNWKALSDSLSLPDDQVCPASNRAREGGGAILAGHGVAKRELVPFQGTDSLSSLPRQWSFRADDVDVPGSKRHIERVRALKQQLLSPLGLIAIFRQRQLELIDDLCRQRLAVHDGGKTAIRTGKRNHVHGA